MKLSLGQVWLNFLSLFPGTLLTLLTIAVAFLRFYDEQDFTILGQITQPRLWSNRLTVAALLVALVNFGVEWDRRNRETRRLEAEATRAENERIEQARRRSEEAARAENERIEQARRKSEEAARAENERIERRYREIQRDRAADEERSRADEERNRADEERNRAAEERERAARRARIQNRGVILQIRDQLEASEQSRRALSDFLVFLQEYGE